MSGVSSIYHKGPAVRDQEQLQADQAKYFKKLWLKNHVAVFHMDDVTNDIDRKIITNLATKLYGKRKNG